MATAGCTIARMSRRVLLLLASSLTACSLLTDLDGFVSTRAAESAGDAGPIEDARPIVTSTDSGPPADAADATPPDGECSEVLLVGNKTLDGSIADGLPNGVIDAYGYEVAQAGRATCVWVYLEGTEGSVALGVYSHDANQGHPGALVARAVVEAPKLGWNGVKLEKPLDVPKPATFWIGLSPLAGSADNRTHKGPCGGLNLHAGPSGSTGTPDTFSVADDAPGFCEALMYLAPAP